MVSEHLKSKQHFNSFTTPFFLELSSVQAALAVSALRYTRERCNAIPFQAPEGRVLVSSQGAVAAMLKVALRCHRCGAEQAGMPALKAHIEACARPLPTTGDVIR